MDKNVLIPTLYNKLFDDKVYSYSDDFMEFNYGIDINNCVETDHVIVLVYNVKIHFVLVHHGSGDKMYDKDGCCDKMKKLLFDTIQIKVYKGDKVKSNLKYFEGGDKRMDVLIKDIDWM